MTARLKEDASACIGMATRLGTWTIETRWDQAFCTATPGTTGTTNSGPEQLADIMTKPCSFQTLSTLAPKIGLTKWLSHQFQWSFAMGRLQSRTWQAFSILHLERVGILNSWHVGCCASWHPRVCAVEFDSTVTRTGTLSWTAQYMCAGPVFSLVFLFQSCSLLQLWHQHSDCSRLWFKGESNFREEKRFQEDRIFGLWFLDDIREEDIIRGSHLQECLLRHHERHHSEEARAKLTGKRIHVWGLVALLSPQKLLNKVWNL